MQPKRIKELLQLYKEASITEAELKELEAIISGDNSGSLTVPALKELMEEDKEGISYDPERFDPLFEQVLKVDRLTGDAPEKPVVSLSRKSSVPARRTWIRYAAAVVLLAGTGSYLFFSKMGRQTADTENENQAVRLEQAPAIAPGDNRAVLVLANGQTILLDSAANGSLAQQGNVSVQKLEDGQLAYLGTGAPTGPVGFNSIVTPRGGQYSIMLPDGTKVWLNSASSLRYPVAFTGKTREVELSGEGYFEVAANKKMPFRVKTSGITVNVLGTSFNIMAYSNEESVNTTLVEGAVKVSGAGSDVLLQPGEQAKAPNSEGKIKVVQADLKETLAWKEGEFRFKRSPIEYIMRQIERWYDVEVVYEQHLPNAQLSGTVARKENAMEILKLLEATKTVQFRVEDKTIMVFPYKK